MVTSTKHNRFLQPAATDAAKTASFDTNFGYLEAGYTEQAIAGVALSQYQLAYLKGIALAAAPTLTPATTGGTLPTETLFVKIVAVIPNGPQYPTVTTAAFLATAEGSAALTGPTASLAVSWAAVNGATSYQVWYGTTAGAENQYITATGTSATITSPTGTSGTVPTLLLPAQWQLASDSVPALPNQRYTIVVAAAAGAVSYGQYEGIVTNSTWSWTPGGLVYASATAGSLTQTAPAGSSVPVGLAISATELSLFVFAGSTAFFTGGTTGSVVFIGSGGALAQDNAQLFWDEINKRLGIATSTPGVPLDVAGAIRGSTTLSVGTTAQTGAAHRFRMLQSMARSHQGVAQSIPNGVFTAVTLDTNDYNTDGIWSSAANTKFTAQIAGKYICAGGGSFGVAAGTGATIVIKVNGLTIYGQGSLNQGFGNGSVADILSLAVGDYVEFYVFQNSGVAISLTAGQSVFGGMAYVGE